MLPALARPLRRPPPDTAEADARRLSLPRSLPASLPLSSASFCSIRAKRSRADGGRRGCSPGAVDLAPALLLLLLLLLLSVADDPVARRRRDEPPETEGDEVADRVPLELVEVATFMELPSAARAPVAMAKDITTGGELPLELVLGSESGEGDTTPRRCTPPPSGDN
jgi:hypothetical protein